MFDSFELSIYYSGLRTQPARELPSLEVETMHIAQTTV